jgi:hypothetical protein
MQQEQLDRLKTWFTGFAASYYKEGDAFLNENIHLKECHTHRVCKEMRDLAGALKMAGPEAVLAETIALLHDVGRFPQFQKWRTYKDTISENHSLLALKVIDEHKLLEGLAEDERAIIVKAVEFHGARELPELEPRTLHFARMIRDTDKLDIFELLTANYRILAQSPEKYKLEQEFPDQPACNPVIVECIMKGETVDYRDLRTVNDAKLLQIGWVFDIYFDYTLEVIDRRRYLQRIIELLPDTQDVRKVSDHILSYVRERIGHVG